MGEFWNSRTAFVCEDVELEWAKKFIDEQQIKTSGSRTGFKSVDVPGFAGDWEQDAPIIETDITSNGHIVTLDTGYYGLINVAKMDLPISLVAVLTTQDSCQEEIPDWIYGVRTANIRNHNFNIDNDEMLPFCSVIKEKVEKLHALADDVDEAVLTYEGVERIRYQMMDEWMRKFDELAKKLLAANKRGELDAPLKETPRLAKFAAYVKANNLSEEDEDPSLYSLEDLMNVKLKYTNSDVFKVDTSEDDFTLLKSEDADIVNAEAASQDRYDKFSADELERECDVNQRTVEFANKYNLTKPAEGDQLLGMINEMEGLGMKDIIELTGYYKEGDDYSNANMAFFDAKIAAERDKKKKAEHIKSQEELGPQQITMANKRFCITGKLSGTRADIDSLIIENNATVKDSLSKNVDFLVVGEDAGSKVQKAKALGITTISEEQLNKLIAGTLLASDLEKCD